MNKHHQLTNNPFNQLYRKPHFIITNRHFNTISSLSPKSHQINFRNQYTLNQQYPTNPHSNQLFIPINNNLNHHYVKQSNSPKTTRNQFNKLSESKYSIELKHMKKEIQILKENLQKRQQLNNQVITTKRQSFHNQLCLSFANTDQSNQQITSQNDLPQQKLAFINMQIDNKGKKQNKDKKYKNGQQNKIDLILKKICQLESSEKGLFKEDKQNQIENKKQLIYTQLLQKIKQKNIELKRIELKHLSLFLNSQESQNQSPIQSIKLNNIPKQWKIFETQLNSLINKFQYTLKDYQKRISDQKLYRNINIQSDKQKDLRNNQIKRIIDQSALKEEENQMIKLQYLKLKNKILTMQEYSSEIQQELKRYKESGKAYLSEMSKLQQLVVNLKQKIQIINAIKIKKQEIEKQYHRIFNDLNTKLVEKQKTIIQLKKKVSQKKTDDHQLQYQSFMNKVEMDKKNFNQIINEINQRISTQVNNLEHFQNSHHITQLMKQLAKIFNVQFKGYQKTMQQIINQVLQNEYLNIYGYYMQVMRTFGVQYNRNANYHNSLMLSIHNFHRDLKLLLLKVEQMDDQIRRKQYQIQNMSQQVKYYHLELQNINSQKLQSSVIQKKVNQDNLLIPSTFQNNKINC